MSQLETLGYSTDKFNQTTFDEAEFEAGVNATLVDDEVTGTPTKVSWTMWSKNHPTIPGPSPHYRHANRDSYIGPIPQLRCWWRQGCQG